jgi:hypothetical protein
LEDIPGKEITDKNGNRLKLCEKCNTPIHLRGALITCMSGCYIGEINWRPEFSDEKPNEENGFNPVVTKMCPKCKLDGYLYFEDGDSWYKEPCDVCGGKGSFKEKKFSECDEPIALEVNEDGGTKCPKCNFRFKITDPNVWSGDRHKRCGQRLIVPDNWLLYWPERS